MMQHAKHIFLMTWLLLLLGVLSAFSQQLTFHVVSFAEDQFDLTARNDQYKKVDGSGSLYAIIKVSGEEGDNLREYQFNFGNMNHLIEEHDGLLWIYVQKNAKRVTIRRNGYTPLLNHDLQTTIEEGKTYRMKLSAQGPVVYTQMVMFQVQPADAKAVVMIRQEDSGSEESMLGMSDASGVIAKNMPFGTYTYRAVAENYNSSEGRFTLNNQEETHREDVVLRPRFSQITLSVNGGAEIYINGERKGSGSWTGPLNAGVYNVECRLVSHRTSSQSITVEENAPRTIELTPPTPITGTLSVISSPVGANIKVDGKDYGVTPRNITGVLIGQREVTLTLEGYDETKATVGVKENETSELNLSLSDFNASFKKAEDLYEKKEYSQAVEIFQRLADQGHAGAQFKLGMCYYRGDGVLKNMEKGFEWYEKAANQGNSIAQCAMGVCYDLGHGVGKDQEKAVYWYEKSANQGYAYAQAFLGECYGTGNGVPKNLQKAVEWCEKAANQGIASAQYNLGWCYANGNGVPQDYQKAVEWYEKAANQGYAEAQCNLGWCYETGNGVAKDLQKAVYWYEKSANQGNAFAQNNLGWCYANGNGVPQDYQKAVEWYEKAANQGYAGAQNNLGRCYETGNGVPKNLQKAVEWYEKAANQGDANAQNNLRICYENGRGVQKDLKKAAYWKKKYEENPNK